MFRFILVPTVGVGARTVLAGYMMASDVGYLHVWLSGSRLTTSYQIQAEYMPIWAFGITLILLGASLAVTRSHRSLWHGRMVAVIGVAIYAFIAATWIEARAYTGAYQYAAGILFLLWEIAHVRGGAQ